MILGSTPPWPQLTSLAMGFRPYFSTASPEASTMAAAPSLMPEALAAVTRWTCLRVSASWIWVSSKVWTISSSTPSGPTGKAPFSLEMPSAVTPGRGNSSTLNSTSSFFFFTMTGTISSSKRPVFWAASAFCWEAAANSSSSWRVMPHTSQMFSAVVPMW